MIPKFFTIENGKVVIDVNCLLIPEFKTVNDAYEDPIPAFSFLYYRYTIDGPYANTPEEDKEEVILEAFPGDYTLEDPEMIGAMNFIEDQCITPTQQYYIDNKTLLEKMGRFAKDTTITAGRDGNIGALSMQLRNVGKVIQEFKVLEKLVQNELSEASGRASGDKKLAYDDDEL